MRAFFLLGLLAVVTPALAQPLTSQYDASRDAELATQQMLARQRDIALSNQISALDAQIRTDQTIRQLEAARARPVLPQVDEGAYAPPAGYARIPDDRLRESNAKVRDVTRSAR